MIFYSSQIVGEFETEYSTAEMEPGNGVGYFGRVGSGRVMDQCVRPAV